MTKVAATLMQTALSRTTRLSVSAEQPTTARDPRRAKSERAAKLQRRLAAASPDIKTVARRRFLSAKTVGSFVPKLTQKAFEKYGFSTAALLTDWAAIAGNQLASHTVPERLKWPRKVAIYQDADEGAAGRPGATLILRVDPAKALDVQYSTQQLIERINRYFGYQAVAQIRILQAPVEPKPHLTGNPQPPAATTAAPQLNSDTPNGSTAHARGEDYDRLQASLRRLEACFKGPATGA